MDDLEKQIEVLEFKFPIESGNAVAAAYQNAIETGQTVMQVIDGELWEVSKTGRKKIKNVEPEFHIGTGTKIKIS